jgi:hypothetical protein
MRKCAICGTFWTTSGIWGMALISGTIPEFMGRFVTIHTYTRASLFYPSKNTFAVPHFSLMAEN